MKRVIVLNTQSGDWQGLFLDGNLIDEGHHLGEGDSFMYMLKLSEKHNFTSKDVRIYELNDEDEDYMCDSGNFPTFLTDLKGTYNEA